MNIHGSGPFHTMKLFTVETCQKMQQMDVLERRQKLCGLLSAFFQDKMPQTPLAVEIAKEMGVDEDLARGAVRVSFGMQNTTEQVNRFLSALEQELSRLRKLMAIAA
jgi:cysteine sulfinate desulfinase/cysteine desulfurase-like protein